MKKVQEALSVKQLLN